MTKSNNTWDKQRGNRKNITKSKDTIDKNNNKWDKQGQSRKKISKYKSKLMRMDKNKIKRVLKK